MTYGYYDIGGMSNINKMIKDIGAPPVDDDTDTTEITYPASPGYVPDVPLTYSAWNAVTGEYVDGYPTQAAADTASMEWAKTKQIIEEEKRQPSTQVSATTPIDVTEIGSGTGDTTMAPWTDWQNVFGELDPSAQYQAMMRTQMPNYAMPGYAAMASRQFDPTFGRFLMQGYGAGGADPTTTGLGTATQFSDWYGGQFPAGATGVGGGGGVGSFSPTAAQTNIAPGWDLARQYSQMGDPTGSAWTEAAKITPGMAYAMTQPDAVQAMALAKYYGGQAPTGGYAGRAVASTLQNLYNQWQAGQVQQGVTAPAGYLDWLANTAGSRWA
jgi:hypothetical protein